MYKEKEETVKFLAFGPMEFETGITDFKSIITIIINTWIYLYPQIQSLLNKTSLIKTRETLSWGLSILEITK